MKDYQIFKPTQSLISSYQLVEASAGTGKTFSITRIFVRLLLEGLDLSQILVLSFTNASTNELRERIRKTLKEAFSFLKEAKKNTSIEAELEDLLSQTKGAFDILSKAMGKIDELNVYTIHSFCQKLLTEESFSTETFYCSNVLNNQRDLEREIVLDEWRTKLCQEDIYFLDFLSQISFEIEEWCEYFHKTNSLISTQKKERPSQEKLEKNRSLLEKEIELCQKKFSFVQKIYQKDLDAFLSLFDKLKKSNKLQKSTVDKASLLFQDYFSQEDFSLFSISEQDAINKFYKSDEWEKDTSELSLSWHAFWASYKKLKELCYKRLFLHLHRIEDNFFKKMEKRYLRERSISYNNILERTYNALYHSSSKEALLENLQKKYKALLVDEFQDTDHIQSQIFEKIFSPKEMPVFFIGDPKQAIYSFRGGDLHVYQSWQKKLNTKYTLEKNFRSTSLLLEGIQTIYENHTEKNPFATKDIQYRKIKTNRGKEKEKIFKEASPSFQVPFRFLYGKTQKNTIAKLREDIARSVAIEIKKILEKPKAKVQSKDIAILARQSSELVILRDALFELGISTVLHVEESVFSTTEACEFHSILDAIWDYNNYTKQKLAIASSLWGYTSKDIYECFQSDERQSRLALGFRNYFKIWQKQGFLSMFRQWLEEEALLEKLLKQREGERILTNLEHIAELIYTSPHKEPYAQLRFLAKEIEEDSNKEDFSQIRLPSQKDAVHLLTIHKSKGLEFPIVFCPYLWSFNSSISSNKYYYYHDATEDEKKLLPPFVGKLGNYMLESDSSEKYFSDDFSSLKIKALKEEQEEELRLVYVALTRASDRLYVHWAPYTNKQKKTSACSYLFAGSDKEGKEHEIIQKRFIEWSKTVPESIYYEEIDLDKLEHLQVSSLVIQKEKLKKPTFPIFHSQIKHKHNIVSFSFLTSLDGEYSKDSSVLHDENLESLAYEENLDNEINYNSILDFPRGAEAGNFFHQILENIDFTEINNEKKLSQEIFYQLKKYDFDLAWKDCVQTSIQKILSTPLFPKENFSLQDVSTKECTKELGFYFTLESERDSEKNERGSKKSESEFWEKLAFYWQGEDKMQSEGRFLRGFIDLIFIKDKTYYLLDWKSNYLGREVENYLPKNLEINMEKSNYYLQSYIYVDALDRYLTFRKKDYFYEKDFGGVFYLYLRGIDGESQNGIYFQKPSYEDLQRFRKLY